MELARTERLTEGVFAGGIAAARGVHAREAARQRAALHRLKRMRADPDVEDEAFEAAFDAAQPAAPLWQQVCGFSPNEELAMDVGARRAGIRRLLRVVETLFRAELKTEDVDAEGAPAKLESGEWSFAGRSAVWDPLNEICIYLEISKAKLNALSLQRSGLRAGEICDCIRAEKLRAHLRGRFRELARAWRTTVEEGARDLLFCIPDLAWKFLKWARGTGRAGNRRRLALEMGLMSRERLNRAVLVAEGESLEEVEVRMAAEVLNELLEAEVVNEEGTPHGAECDGGVEEAEMPESEVRSSGVKSKVNSQK